MAVIRFETTLLPSRKIKNKIGIIEPTEIGFDKFLKCSPIKRAWTSIKKLAKYTNLCRSFHFLNVINLTIKSKDVAAIRLRIMSPEKLKVIAIKYFKSRDDKLVKPPSSPKNP